MRRPALPALPWGDMNAQDACDVLRVLGRSPVTRGERPVEGGRKYGCLWCDSSDAMHAYPKGRGGVHCFSCGRTASNVDTAAHLLGATPAEAVRELARRLGGMYVPDVPGAPGPRQVRETPPLPDPRLAADDVELEARDGGYVPTAPADIYAALLAFLGLDDAGADYIARRGFDPDAAQADGFRNIANRKAWEVLWGYLSHSYLPGELTAAGFPGRNDLPWAGRIGALVIPYWHRGAVVAIRFRALDTHVTQRYATLPGVKISEPYNADALDAAADDELHIVEGELNARALTTHGLHAIGLPGAAAWRPHWARRCASVARLVAWYDDDRAGHDGRRGLAASLARSLGSEWLTERGYAYTVPPGHGDVADLHRAGHLAALVALAPWRSFPAGSPPSAVRA